jgi:hypothetical protein
MSIASRLGPWLLGTVRETTGSTVGTLRNMGATSVVQTKAVAFGDAAASVAFTLPAGALIKSATLIPTTAFTSGSTATVALLVAGSAVTGSVTISTGTTTAISIPLGTSNPALVANVGTTDVNVTYTIATATAGAGVLHIDYMVRNADGTYGVNA